MTRRYCAQRLYKKSTKWTTPNTTFQYLSNHLQFAGAMAVRPPPAQRVVAHEQHKPHTM
jgi:hypothetical protein